MPLSMAELSHVPKHPFSQRMWKLWLPSRSENLVITKSSSFFFSISDSVPISCNLSVIWLQWQPSPHNLQTEKFKKNSAYTSVSMMQSLWVFLYSLHFPDVSPFSGSLVFPWITGCKFILIWWQRGTLPLSKMRYTCGHLTVVSSIRSVIEFDLCTSPQSNKNV